MAEIIWTEPALSDLNDIAEYIALENIVAAKQLVQTIFSKVERLQTFPESGRIPPELEYLSYREVVVNPCRVFYKQDGDKVFILFVMRAERDLRKFLLSKQ
ncbi:type II toxin-antitoxin system RelE/ParE family toxin [Vibrio parahaemolyticus]|uniref:type II toxin-antitoxin system RelE/ParE family toxin n=1 Tax=Vibrio parahaemolyticus TaxID=670 RepID=UPI0003ED8B89|nr:type II toxin-antitoxin system RelE/ParE family toxin [Vibrio parahaemolyticus]AHI99371.1 Death on curing protein, Doc toxin [Vibrio parahaemolyticus UCM-V493]EHH1057645.1 type II toxin-antitoxin system RelE/ParE family toxin [Vibrio parahaemolyticus]EHW0695328.1 type II toxin-antitoxin system RelE/ParE family toxin [Vibrio parahaemolyticus]EIU6803087.1 type II toxin-antitoxin system RelE/ParE family toxin [Vibrio parahaemolyticus]EJE8522667.1 type II toxin-antitoxin system RelE/ParE family